MRAADQRGLTLTEMMIVIVLAAILMTGIAAFYLNAQSTWVDGSTQAISQREATLVLSAISKRGRQAVSVGVGGTATQGTLTFIFPGGAPNWCYWWNPGDSLIYEGTSIGSGRPMLQSPVECFSVHADNGVYYTAYIDTLRVRSAQGQHVTMSTSVTMMNHP